MAGLDKIKSQILDEAKVTADAKIEDAKAQAEQMKLKAQEEGARQADSGSIYTSAGGRDLFLRKRSGKYAGRIWQRN